MFPTCRRNRSQPFLNVGWFHTAGQVAAVTAAGFAYKYEAVKLPVVFRVSDFPAARAYFSVGDAGFDGWFVPHVQRTYAIDPLASSPASLVVLTHFLLETRANASANRTLLKPPASQRKKTRVLDSTKGSFFRSTPISTIKGTISKSLLSSTTTAQAHDCSNEPLKHPIDSSRLLLLSTAKKPRLNSAPIYPRGSRRRF